MSIPPDYSERVYAGVLGKMIGVYLGRPFEGWTYEQIMAELGEISGYVHERFNVPLVVTDDDLSGTFTFLRALEDYGYTPDLTPAQIGQGWLNYIIENRTILWWGGVGHSTEHTAFLRLKRGIPAPTSGSMGLNGRIIAEQIGAQIFIDSWGMIAPGDPEMAADWARRAASVSHDGEAIYGAQIVAALVAQAFVEPDLSSLLKTAVSFIPANSTLYRLIADIQEWHALEPDWRVARGKLAACYGYDKYGGNCHIVPNHGLIILSLLYGNDDLRRSLMIANTSGWDTDCNSGNVGCILGVKNGLAGIETIADLREPVADRLYLSTADGGRSITDAVQETMAVVNAGRALHDLPRLALKNGAKFHFSLPGSVQGFRTQDKALRVSNAQVNGDRCLALSFELDPRQPAFAGTDTFIPQEGIDMPGYELLASPTLYAGQTVEARLLANAANRQPVQARLYLRHYGADDALVLLAGPQQLLVPGQAVEFTWTLDLPGEDPIAEIGIMLESAAVQAGTVYLDYLTWTGEPDVLWQRPSHNGTMWGRAWVDALDHCFTKFDEMFRLAQDNGRGLLMQGTRQWQNITLSATLTPYLARRFGLAGRVQGLQRYYALLVDQQGGIELLRVCDGETVLATAETGWDGLQPLALSLQITDTQLSGWVDGVCVATARDPEGLLLGGGVALVVEEGCIHTHAVRVAPLV
jgi:ADP-ribosylglycohydrolase